MKPWTVQLSTAILVAMVALSLGMGTPLADEGGAEPSVAAPMEFWPQRLDPDVTPRLYVQLSQSESLPLARLECDGATYDLGNPMWSHPLGFVHSFDLEWTAPRIRTRCNVVVSGRKGRVYAPERTLALRPKQAPSRIRSVLPDYAVEGKEGPVEVRAQGFGKVVGVTWIATDRYESWQRSARVSSGRGSSIIVPFAPGASRAPPGDYLLAVENEDHSGAVYGDAFVVTPDLPAEIESSRLDERDGRRVLTLVGFNLEAVEEALLELPAGQLPLAVRHEEGTALPTVTVRLPTHSVDSMTTVSELTIEDDRLVIRIEQGSRLTHAPSETPPSRD
jgi:hypothetical protein